jgi:hypothetical protein
LQLASEGLTAFFLESRIVVSGKNRATQILGRPTHDDQRAAQ